MAKRRRRKPIISIRRGIIVNILSVSRGEREEELLLVTHVMPGAPPTQSSRTRTAGTSPGDRRRDFHTNWINWI